VPAPIEIESEIEGILFFGDSSFFEFPVPTAGLTLSLEGTTGNSVMYVSDKIKNPNAAFHDFSYDSQRDRGGLFVDVDLLSGGRGGGRGKRADSNFTDSTLYVTVEGLQERNQFSLFTTFGNTCELTLCIDYT